MVCCNYTPNSELLQKSIPKLSPLFHLTSAQSISSLSQPVTSQVDNNGPLKGAYIVSIKGYTSKFKVFRIHSLHFFKERNTVFMIILDLASLTVTSQCPIPAL